jgi:drug/metabolite transporter (DMT)-like permease
VAARPIADPAGGPDSDAPRLRQLQVVGVCAGLTAGAWLGAAEAPTKLVVTGLSPVLVSFCMVLGVFIGRWSMPALVHGTGYVRDDVRQAPHLVVWAVLGGCLWAVANTLTVFAIRDVGLSIAFPLWNTNSLIGILWGVLFFNELRGASRARRIAVVGGAALMCGAAAMVAIASSGRVTPAHALRGVVAALTAGALWGTMYIPYRKAYLTGLSPLSFLTFFTVGELAIMCVLALSDAGGWLGLWHTLVQVRAALLWLLLGGFVWVVGDVLQQYAAKYVGISRGIPLSNTNQLWGLVWGALVFGEFRGAHASTVAQIAGGSAVMVLGAGLIALASAGGQEQAQWRAAAVHEGARYGVDPTYTRARGLGRETGSVRYARSWIDWLVVAAATAVFVVLGAVATAPHLTFSVGWAAILTVAMLALLTGCGLVLWRTTRFV